MMNMSMTTYLKILYRGLNKEDIYERQATDGDGARETQIVSGSIQDDDVTFQ